MDEIKDQFLKNCIGESITPETKYPRKKSFNFILLFKKKNSDFAKQNKTQHFIF
jgi:hypothetical protein